MVTYPITINAKSPKLSVNLSKTIIGIPVKYMVGTYTDRAKLYDEWLYEHFSSSIKVMRYLTELHILAKKYGSLNFIANRGLSTMEAAVVKAFFKNHQDVLEQLISLFGLDESHNRMLAALRSSNDG